MSYLLRVSKVRRRISFLSFTDNLRILSFCALVDIMNLKYYKENISCEVIDLFITNLLE